MGRSPCADLTSNYYLGFKREVLYTLISLNKLSCSAKWFIASILNAVLHVAIADVL